MYVSRVLEKAIETSFENNKVLFLSGARQVGKTTLVQKILQRHTGAILNMDIDSERDRLLIASKQSPNDAVRFLGGQEVLIIDEAQRVEEIGRICKGWYDSNVKTKIILLGSSSVNLLDSAAADLTGRNEKLWLTPLLFQEVVAEQAWFNLVRESALAHQDFPDQLRGLVLQRLIFGSYPEAFLSPNPSAYLANLTGDYLLKDIFAASLIRSPEDVRRLLVELATSIGQPLSVLQLATRLHLNRKTVEKYLRLLEGIFVIFTLPSYATDPIKEVHRSTKYYFWDNGVRNALLREWTVSDTRSDIQLLWENWVMAEIFKQSRTFNRQEDLFFWQSRNGSEVQLIVKQGENLFPFDMSFDDSGGKPSRAFKSKYGKLPTVIHPHNFLQYIA